MSYRFHIRFLVSCCFIICYSVVTNAENLLTISSANAQPADTIALSIDITNNDPFVAFQCDVLIPESMNYIGNSAMLSDRSVDHVLSVTFLEGNCLRIIVFSPNNNFFLGNEGDVLTFDINTGNTSGWFPLNLENAIIANENSLNICSAVANGWINVQSTTGSWNQNLNEYFEARVFPNPFTTDLRLELFMKRPGNILLIIMDLQGRIIYQEPKERALPQGKHIIQIVDLQFPEILKQKSTYLFRVIVRTEREVNNFTQLITKL